MKGKFYFIVLLVTAAVGLTAWYGNRTLSQMLQSLRDEVQPNERREITQKILFDMQVAENSMNAYILSRNANDLEDYYKTATTIDRQLIKVSGLNEGHEEFQKLYRTLKSSIERKFLIMDQLIELRSDGSTDEVFNRVLGEYDRMQRESDSLALISEDGQGSSEMPGVFRKLLQRIRQKKDTLAVKDSIIKASTDSLLSQSDSLKGEGSIKDIIREIQTDQQTKKRELVQQEAALVQEERKLDRRIAQTISRMEQIDQSGSEDRARTAEELYQRTERIILMSFSVFLLIFLFLVIIIFNDLRKLRENRILLEEERKKALMLADAKSEFLSRMSHELRTPLNSLIGFSESLNKRNTTEKELVSPILFASRHLYNIVNDILDFSKIEAGMVQFEVIPFSPQEEVKQVLTLMQVQSEERKLHLSYHSAGSIQVVGDPIRYRQVVINLVGNAIKFTPSGGKVTIKISYSDGLLSTSVQDTGIGIPEDKQTAIFESFAQADAETTRKYGGTGLGLSISKRLVDLQGGSLILSSEVGKGSTFTFTLPLPYAHNFAFAEAEKREVIQYKGKRVGVVDDEEFNRRLLRVMMEDRGIEILEAADAATFLELAAKQLPDLVFMDIHMPGKSGMDLLTEFKTRFGSKVPVVAFTAGVGETERKAISEAGFDGILAKPVEERIFEAHLQQFLGTGSVEADVDMGVNELTARNNLPKGIESLRKLAGSDLGFVSQMLLLYVEDMDRALVALQESIGAGDYTKLREISHSMCGPSAQLKLGGIYEILRKMEDIAKTGTGIQESEPWMKALSTAWEQWRMEILSEQEKLK